MEAAGSGERDFRLLFAGQAASLSSSSARPTVASVAAEVDDRHDDETGIEDPDLQRRLGPAHGEDEAVEAIAASVDTT
jgi:hypothetical protein